MIGMFAVSLMGHDKGQMYVIINEAGEYIYVADGKIRTVERLKRKNRRHIQLIKKGIDIELSNKLQTNQPVSNEEIKYAIKVRQTRR